MKKIFLLAISFAFFATNLTAQNNNTTVTAPTGAVLVPGTQQLYTTSSDEVSKMMRSAAVSACITHGDGWRLPTLGELKMMYSHRFEMDFGEGNYWSGDKVRGEFAFYALNFKNGKTLESKHDKEFFVRCVWTPQNGASVAPNPAPAEPTPVNAPAAQPTEKSTSSEAAPTPATTVAPAPTAAENNITPAKASEEKTNFFPPYRHGIGAVAGNLNGFSYKVFPADKFAVSVDFGVKITAATVVGEYNYLSSHGFAGTTRRWINCAPMDLEANVNFLYQGHFTKGLYGIIGGGPSLGYNWNVCNYYTDNYYYSYYGWGDNAKIGLGMLLGLEYKFDIPLAVQADFRPGYAMLLSRGFFGCYFDWGLNLSLRYAFSD